jgi:hypothetical protein
MMLFCHFCCAWCPCSFLAFTVVYFVIALADAVAVAVGFAVFITIVAYPVFPLYDHIQTSLDTFTASLLLLLPLPCHSSHLQA